MDFNEFEILFPTYNETLKNLWNAKIKYKTTFE